MAEINQNASAGNEALAMVLESMLVDLTNVRAAVNASIVDVSVVRAALNVAVSKLNADGGVSDTNYAAATALTASAAGALTTTS